MSRHAGMIYVADGASAQALSTTAAKMTGFATDGHDGAAVDGDTSVQSDAANDKITLGSPGLYWVHLDIFGTSSGANIQIRAAVRRDATEIADLQTGDEPSGANEGCQMSVAGPVLITEAMLTDGEVDLEVYLESESGTPNFTPVHAHLSVMRLD